MPNKVKVFNANTYPIREVFKGEEMEILAQDYWRDKKGNIRELDVFEANDYKGQYCPIPIDGSGKMLGDAKYFKMIRLEPVGVDADDDEEDEKVSAFKCMSGGCKHVSPSSEELEAHVKVRHPNAESLILPDVDKEIRKRGRPAKEQVA